MALQVSEKTVEKQLVLSLRKKDASYSDLQGLISNTYITVLEIIKESKGVQVTGKIFHLLHGSTDDALDVEICVPVDQKTPGKDNIQFSELPGGSVASTLVKGGYENVFAAYPQLEEWLKSNGKQAKGPARTIFLKSPLDTGDEHAWETEIQIPF
eukprot:TRINITY_DN1599_c0_g1_i1.p1 TRINITY_DN1599_c0_g1~~TRINITY_DN1599_c0_g1_i1.p1  ORF type:complete len:155 (-),score=52.64 TRINITY_DN1599_c0_g1_i1:322-786(-)